MTNRAALLELYKSHTASTRIHAPSEPTKRDLQRFQESRVVEYRFVE